MSSTTETDNGSIFECANIILAGIAGAGKSTLVNAVFGEEFAVTGKGRPITKEITEYSNSEIPVRIWDSIGFEIGNNEEGVSKTRAAIQKIKATIEEQASKSDVNHIHAIWYCINQGCNRYQKTESDFVKELHAIGVPFIMIITQCVEDDDVLTKEVDRLNKENGINDIPVIEVLAKEKRLKGGGCIPAFGLEALVDKTLMMLPDFVKNSFIAGQQIKVVLKREACEDIIEKYEAMAERGFWDKIPLINIITVDKKFKEMGKEIFALYNTFLNETMYDKILLDISNKYTKDLFIWSVLPSRFSNNKDKIEKLMSDFDKNGAEGLDLHEREFNNSARAARMITFYGYTLLMAVEDVWTMIREKKIQNLEEIVIPQIKERIQYYLSSKRQNGDKTGYTSIPCNKSIT